MLIVRAYNELFLVDFVLEFLVECVFKTQNNTFFAPILAFLALFRRYRSTWGWYEPPATCSNITLRTDCTAFTASIYKWNILMRCSVNLALKLYRSNWKRISFWPECTIAFSYHGSRTWFIDDVLCDIMPPQAFECSNMAVLIFAVAPVHVTLLFCPLQTQRDDTRWLDCV